MNEEIVGRAELKLILPNLVHLRVFFTIFCKVLT